MNIASTQKLIFPELTHLFGFKTALLIVLGIKLRNISKESKDKLIHLLSFDSTKETRLKKIKLVEGISSELSNSIIESMRFEHFNLKDFEKFINSFLALKKIS